MRYQLGIPPNTTIAADPATASDAFRGLDVQLHISRVKADCSLAFLGSLGVQIWEPQAFALQPGQNHYLVLALDGGKLKGGGHNIAAMIDPRAGHSYRLLLSYSNDAYQLQLRERASDLGERPIPHEPHACQPDA